MKVIFSYFGLKRKYKFTADIRELIKIVFKEEKKTLGEIHIIFTNNPRILEINIKFLNHSYYTDVITFANNSLTDISGEIYISIDQVIMNSTLYKTSEVDELVRVIIHGVLHLIGYNDKTEKEQIAMRKLEDNYLSKLKSGYINENSEIKL